LPFACVAVDLNSAANIIINKGAILEAILASSSIPGIFAPVKYGDKLLSDGGILSLMPVQEARSLGADFVIGVDIAPNYVRREFFSGLDVMFQADIIKSFHLNKLNAACCDFIIKPDIADINWSSFSRGEFCIKQGEKAAMRKIEDLQRLLNKKRRIYFIKRLFKRNTQKNILNRIW